MYSSLSHFDLVEQISEMRFLWKILRTDFQHYMVVRCPYERLVSFYFDKLQIDPARRIDGKFQYCQKLFLKLVNGTIPRDVSEAIELLKSITFEQYICLLPMAIRNRHLRPQCKILKCVGQRLHEVTTFVRLEDDLKILEKYVGFDANLKVNSTMRPSAKEMFTSQLTRLVDDLYEEDFSFLPYKQVTNDR